MGRFGTLNKAKLIKGFQLVQEWTPTIKCETREGFVRVPALTASTSGAEFQFEFVGTGVGLMIGAGPDTGILEFSIDGGPMRKVDTFTKWSQGLYLPWALMLADDLKHGKHAVSVQISRARNSKSVGTALHVFQLLEN